MSESVRPPSVLRPSEPFESSGAKLAKIGRTGPQLRSKYPKSAPVPRVRSVPDPLGKVAHFILFYSAIKNFTLPPTDFKHSLYGFMKLNSNASNRPKFTKQLPSAPLPCTAGSSSCISKYSWSWGGAETFRIASKGAFTNYVTHEGWGV